LEFFFFCHLLGTTYVECKTGYGLEWPDELRLLKLLEQARSYIPIGISITYCAAHAIPKYEEKKTKK
jgi:imidazolonepropionase